jgi:uncharacterized phage-associated protein
MNNDVTQRTERPAANAADVARYLIRHYGAMAQLKLQKLLYFCQAASWAWRHGPLFADRIEAWSNGPVVVSFWRNHPYEGVINAVPEGNNIEDRHIQSLIDAVYSHFGHYEPEQLSDMTHRERPWLDARRGLAEGQRGSVAITDEAMQHYIRAWAPNGANHT